MKYLITKQAGAIAREWPKNILQVCDTIINTKYITKMQKPHIWLGDFFKITMTKERWKKLEILLSS